jgi:hypothetical protein
MEKLAFAIIVVFALLVMSRRPCLRLTTAIVTGP